MILTDELTMRIYQMEHDIQSTFWSITPVADTDFLILHGHWFSEEAISHLPSAIIRARSLLLICDEGGWGRIHQILPEKIVEKIIEMLVDGQ